MTARVGFVSLVGAGPGDPGLLTVKGRRAIERADVVLYDLLAHPTLLDAVSVPGQERIHVGKLAGAGLSAQEAINALLVKRARAGERVCRLKGGDPLLFGRGSEEIEACLDAGIPFEVVPGVSSIQAAPAYAGIPLTHRDLASSVTVATGHEKEAGGGRVDWAHVGGAGGTVVVLMGIGEIDRWTAGMLAGGRAAETPVAFVRWGTLPKQETLVTTLGEAAAAVARAGLRSPCVAVVGEVVTLREHHAWFERLPLQDQVIGLTRDTADDLSVFEPLVDMGAHLAWIPLTRKVPTAEAAHVAARVRAGGFTDLVFTSGNGVRVVKDALDEAGLDARALAGVATWAVGGQTAGAMRAVLGVGADHVPAEATAEGLVALAQAVGVAGRRFLFPAARDARRVMPEGLAALGAAVEQVPVYETVPEPSAEARLITA
ncbi:MAG: uroporphyrinogen-III C-methyltransferase, partial [Myxococcales bacterium]|nr:uroporphyrinogen-III C-methyltransferase [Myxococcales bacterium]